MSTEVLAALGRIRDTDDEGVETLVELMSEDPLIKHALMQIEIARTAIEARVEALNQKHDDLAREPGGDEL